MLEEMIAKKQQLQESSLLCVLAIGPAAEFEKARSSNPFAGHFVCKPRRCVYLLSCVEAASRFCLHKDKYNSFWQIHFFGKKNFFNVPGKGIAVG
jgi:hypothetical protein